MHILGFRELVLSYSIYASKQLHQLSVFLVTQPDSALSDCHPIAYLPPSPDASLFVIPCQYLLPAQLLSTSSLVLPLGEYLSAHPVKDALNLLPSSKPNALQQHISSTKNIVGCIIVWKERDWIEYDQLIPSAVTLQDTL